MIRSSLSEAQGHPHTNACARIHTQGVRGSSEGATHTAQLEELSSQPLGVRGLQSVQHKTRSEAQGERAGVWGEKSWGFLVGNGRQVSRDQPKVHAQNVTGASRQPGVGKTQAAPQTQTAVSRHWMSLLHTPGNKRPPA